MSVEILLGDYRDTIGNVKADLIFTSPPYNIGSKAKRKDGLRKLGKYDPKSYGSITDYPDSLDEDEYQSQQVAFLNWAFDHLKKDGVLVYNHKPRRRDGRMIHPMEWFVKAPKMVLMEEVIWDRCSTHNHCSQLVWPHTERLYVLRRFDGQYRFRNKPDMVFRSDIWRLPRARANGHNAPFPIELAEEVVKAWSPRGGLVIDTYCGSGTTAVAARDLGRSFIGSEKMEKYHTLALERLGVERLRNAV